MALDQNVLNSLRIERNTPPPRTPRSSWKYGKPVLAVIMVSMVAGWWWTRHKIIEVEVTTAVSISNNSPSTVLDASGYVVARRQATVSAKVTGKVAEVFVEEGMHVKADQILATLDNSTATRQLELSKQQANAARSELSQIQVRLDEAQRATHRGEQLRHEKLISEAELDALQSTTAALRAQLGSIQSQVSVAEANIQLQQQNISDFTVRAPFAGVVISKDAQPGEMISPISAGGGFTRTGIATLVDMDSREVEVDVNEAFINRVIDGQKTEATLDAYPDWTIPSHVISIVPTADRQKATVKVRIGFDQLDPRILPDMGVKVRFLDNTEKTTNQHRQSIQLPSTSVVHASGNNYVWRLKDDMLEKVAITIGNERSGQIEILSGIQAGDSVVTQPTESLQDGAKVRVKTVTP